MVQKFIKNSVDFLLTNQPRFAVAGLFIGSNIGVYSCIKEESYVSSDIRNFISGIFLGGFIGSVVGLSAPFLVPAAVFSIPGYTVAKLHTYLQESGKKGGKQEVQMK